MFRLLLFVSILLVPVVSFAESTFTYTVKKNGETCEQIAEDVYGDAGRVDLLHKYNDLTDKCWLGANKKAHKLTGGTKLKLPDPPPAGRISDTNGKVNSKSPSADWSPAELGLELFRLWRVNTLDKSQAEVTFRDRSRLEMRENTLILIYGSTKSKARQTPSRASLEKGALRSKLDELAGGGVIVETPSSVAEVQSKSTLVKVEDSGTTRVANHGEGTVGVSSNKKKRSKKKRKKVTVAKGMGTKIEKDKEPEKPRPLPPTPTWKDSPELFITIGEQPTTIFAEWDAVNEADSYYVEVAVDDAAETVIQSVVVPKKITRLQVENLPPGDYFASIAAIDNDQFESIPTGPRKIRVREVKPQGTMLGTDPIKVALGTSFLSPKDIKCSPEDVEPARRTVIDSIGEQSLRCIDASGQDVGAFTVVGVVPAYTMTSDALEDDVLTLAKRQVIDVTFDPQIPNNVQFTSELLRVDPPVRVDEKTLRFAVKPKPGVHEGAATLSVGDHALGSVGVKTGKAVQGPAFTLGVGASYTNVQSADRFSAPVGDWGLLEVFAGIAPNRRISAELGIGFGAADSNDGFVGAIDYRVTGRFNLLTDALRPFLSASVGGQTHFDLSESVAIARGGIGLSYHWSPNAGVRLDLDVGVADGGETEISILPRGVVGFVYTFD